MKLTVAQQNGNGSNLQ